MRTYYIDIYDKNKRWKLLTSYDTKKEVINAFNSIKMYHPKMRIRKVQTTILYEKPTKEIK